MARRSAAERRLALLRDIEVARERQMNGADAGFPPADDDAVASRAGPAPRKPPGQMPAAANVMRNDIEALKWNGDACDMWKPRQGCVKLMINVSSMSIQHCRFVVFDTRIQVLKRVWLKNFELVAQKSGAFRVPLGCTMIITTAVKGKSTLPSTTVFTYNLSGVSSILAP